MGGVMVTPDSLHNRLMMYRKDLGRALHGRSVWPILVHGLSTLGTRLRRQMETACKLTHFLAKRPQVKEVHYPSLETYRHYSLAKKLMRSHDGSFAPGIGPLFIRKGKQSHARENSVKLINSLARNALNYTLV